MAPSSTVHTASHCRHWEYSQGGTRLACSRSDSGPGGTVWLRCCWHGVTQMPVAWWGSGAGGTASSVPPLSLCCPSDEPIDEQISDGVFSQISFSLSDKSPLCPPRTPNVLTDPWAVLARQGSGVQPVVEMGWLWD